MIGTWVGSYRILEKLGQGGMGEVYKAEDGRLKRLGAIKVLRRDKAAPDELRGRFLQEARAASALNNPNIVQIYELESEGGSDFIGMQLVAGRTLAQLLSERRRRVVGARDHMAQLAAALAAAQSAGIEPLDIKPRKMRADHAGVLSHLDCGPDTVE